MKHICFILLAWYGLYQARQEIYVCKNATVSLYSKAPIEDIDAVSEKGTSVFNATAGDIAFSVPIRSFKFDKSLMQEHFNENYMESDKYPQANFRGKITSKPDLTKDGDYPVSATGTFDIHGVKQNKTVNGHIVVANGIVSISAEFMVACKDHNIEIPTLVFKNIAENIRVRVSATYSTYKQTP